MSQIQTPQAGIPPTGKCPSLAQAVQQIDEVSSLPHVALRVMEVANDPDSGAVDLKDIMEGDTALSARVLRCVNSSAYGLRSPVTNLQQAIAYLGLKQIRNLAMTISVSELFQESDGIGPYSRSQLWKHMISVGICSRMLAMRLKIPDFEDVFLAGLLHDIGIILEDQYIHDYFVATIEALDEKKALPPTERAHIGFDHAALGKEVGALWGFPEVALAAIEFHHVSVNYRGKHIKTVRCVEVANLLCTLKGIPSVGLKLVRFSAPAFTGLGLSKADIAVLSEDLDKELTAQSSLFQA